MTLFKYKARDADGILIESVKEAKSASEVVDFLNRKDLTVIDIEEKKRSKIITKSGIKKFFEKGTRIKKTDIAIFCRQMSTMLNAGVTISVAISSVIKMTQNPALKDILHRISIDVTAGSTLSDSLKKHRKVFNRLFIPMIQVGEKSGRLDVVFADLAEYTEQAVETQRKIQSATMYPVVVSSFMLLVLAGVLLFLIPQFRELFEMLGGDLPLPTAIALSISDAVIAHIHFVLLATIIIVVSFKMALKIERFRYLVHRFLLNLPVLGGFLEKVFLARFFHALSALLKSGVNVLDSLDISKNVIGSLPYAYGINDLKLTISQGSYLSTEMASSPLFTEMASAMVAVGEKSGNIPEMLDKVHEYYTKYISNAFEKLSSIIEPIMIIFLGILVGIFVIVMYLPIFQMAATIG